MMPKKGWIGFSVFWGLTLGMVPGVIADEMIPYAEVIPVSTGSAQVVFDANEPRVQAAPAQEDARKRKDLFKKLAQSIPGMETLDPNRGQIVDDSAPMELPEDDGKEKARDIKVHKRYKRASFITYNQYFGAGQVSEEIDSIGEVIGYVENLSLNEMETRQGLIPLDVVYLDVGVTSNLKIGDRLVVFSQDQEVRHPLGWFDRFFDTREVELTDGDYSGEFAYDVIKPGGTARGQKIVIRGLVEITELTAEYSKAKVIYGYSFISKGNQVMPIPNHRPPMVATRYQPKHKDVRGYILDISGEHLMSGKNNFVHIDKGSEHEIKVGDRMEVYVRPNSVETDIEEIMPHIIGELVVVSVQPETATTLVINSTQPIFPGQRFRGKMVN